MRMRDSIVVLLGLSLALGGTAHAGIFATNGMMTAVSPPLDLRFHQFESTLAVFQESEHPAQWWFMYDWLVPDPGPNPAGPYQGDVGVGITAPSDEPFEVYMIHWDSPGETVGTGAGSVTFSPGHRVFALVTGDPALDSTDSTLGHPNVIYPFMMEWRGSSETVPGAGPDPITISPDRRTVTVSFTTTLAADEARILVAIPEPACAMVLLLGFSAATFRRGRQ